MERPSSRIKRPMPITADYSTPEQRWTAWLLTEKRRDGVDAEQAKAAVARVLKAAPGTIENITRGRVKDIRRRLSDRIREAFIGSLEREIAALEHELQLARACGHQLGEDEVISIQAHLASARSLLEGKR